MVRLGVIIALVTGVLMVGCGGNDDRAKNAAEFRQKAGAINHKIELEPQSETHPGLVIGEATTKDGISTSFALSFGPAPEKLLPVLEREGATWIEAGDQVNYWIEDFPTGVLTARRERALNMRFAIEDLACRVVAGNDCRY
ncbi:MAG: hypothetical protein ACSLFI_08040 [Solirubrobacterales bacterium]